MRVIDSMERASGIGPPATPPRPSDEIIGLHVGCGGSVKMTWHRSTRGTPNVNFAPFNQGYWAAQLVCQICRSIIADQTFVGRPPKKAKPKRKLARPKR